MDSALTFKSYLAAFLAASLVPIAALSANPAAATAVLYNSNDPESRDLALYYATRRNIPISQIIGLNCPTSEEISREEFNATIAIPLKKQFVTAGWWTFSSDSTTPPAVIQTRIRFVAIVRGIPLKISHDHLIGPAKHLPGIAPVVLGRNDASVDSEIAALGLPEFTPAGLMLNPYFGRFTPILEDRMPPGLLLPCRLDAPSTDTVRRMIDDSITTEKRGLWGWAYVDSRGLRNDPSGDLSYVEGDDWMLRIAAQVRQRGMPVLLNQSADTFPQDFPVTDAALYFGWYAPEVNGPFLNEEFQFRQGAIAVHLHSFSAATLRDISTHWCGPLLELGAAATLGNVYEPYLIFTSHLDILQDRLMSNLTLAEAGYMSQRSISWAGVIIGDPLYRPFAAWDRFFESSAAVNPWRQFRRITTNSGILNAVLPLHEEAHKTGDSMFIEGLGSAQADAGHDSSALHSLRSALAISKYPETSQRLRMEIAAIENRLSDTPPVKTP
jgi:uncharacterized protein (TIGR03790 family)